MSVITMSADSTTLILNGAAISNFGEGDFLSLKPVNPLSSHINSATGVSIARRIDGNVYDLTFRVQRYSDDDVMLNNWTNSETLAVINGSCREAFQRDGADFLEAWELEGGSITSLPSATKNNQDADALMEYTIRFRRARRSL